MLVEHKKPETKIVEVVPTPAPQLAPESPELPK